MEIRICTKNLPKLDAALAAANGKAECHTYSGYDLLAVSAAAESYALNVLQSKKWVVLAQWESASGAPVSRSYSYSRISTVVRIKRRDSAWYLISVKVGSVDYRGGKGRLILTVAQHNHAANLAAQRYTIGGSNGK
mgnify:CR=1 FL=1